MFTLHFHNGIFVELFNCCLKCTTSSENARAFRCRWISSPLLPTPCQLPLIIISILKYFELAKRDQRGPLVYLAPACSLRMQSQIAALNEININFYELFPVNEKQDASCDGHEQETFSLAQPSDDCFISFYAKLE